MARFLQIAEGSRVATARDILRILEEPALDAPVEECATALKQELFGNEIHLRGILEFSNICTRRCAYCGIRAGAKGVQRYRMAVQEVIERARLIQELGYGTLVLQGGEDPQFGLEEIVQVVRAVKQETPIAITLSIGEFTEEEYRIVRQAGADRVLLRFETCSAPLYSRHHPDSSLAERISVLHSIRRAGFQTGTGFLIGLPGADLMELASNIVFTSRFQPDMIGVGPYIPAGEVETTLPRFRPEIYFKTISLLRILNPKAHLPATTAFDSFAPGGRERLLRTSCNVFMPNITPKKYRDLYHLYPQKSCVDAQCWHFTKMDDTLQRLGLKRATGPGHSLLEKRGGPETPLFLQENATRFGPNSIPQGEPPSRRVK